MREKNETPLAVCTVAIYADSDKLERQLEAAAMPTRLLRRFSFLEITS